MSAYFPLGGSDASIPRMGITHTTRTSAASNQCLSVCSPPWPVLFRRRRRYRRDAGDRGM